MMRSKMGFATLLLFATACDGSTGPENGGSVAIRFGAGSSARANVLATTPGARADELTLTGTNGTLVIQDVRFIVEELEFRSSNGNSACSDDDNGDDRGGSNNLVAASDGERGRDHPEDDGDECEFEDGPFLVDLPLDGEATITTANVPPGTYDSFRFEIDDLDDDDEEDRARAAALLSEMRSVYPDFPRRASLVVRGTQDGEPFTVFFRSKIRLSQQISPALTIPGDDVLTVNLDPAAWFKNANQIVNLRALNGQLIELGEGFSRGVSGTHGGRGRG